MEAINFEVMHKVRSKIKDKKLRCRANEMCSLLHNTKHLTGEIKESKRFWFNRMIEKYGEQMIKECERSSDDECNIFAEYVREVLRSSTIEG